MTQRKLTIPVASKTYDLLQQLACEQGQSLAAFCRERIMEREHLADAFATLQRTLIATLQEVDRPQSVGNTQTHISADLRPMLAEVLLLMRSLTPPQKIQAIHGDLKRIGMTPFIIHQG